MRVSPKGDFFRGAHQAVPSAQAGRPGQAQAGEDTFGSVYSGWIEEALKVEAFREPAWSESVAVGSKKFVAGIKEELAFKAIGRKIQEGLHVGTNTLREPNASYSFDFGIENGALSDDNSLFLSIFPDLSDG